MVYVSRYGHQSISELRRMKYADFVAMYNAVIRLVQRENDANAPDEG